MDLTTGYMGIALRNPLIASAAPLTADLATLRALEDHGAGAVVLPSLFEEQVLAERHECELRTEAVAHGCAEAETFFPAYVGCRGGPDRYLDLVARAKGALTIPVIASVNCVTHASWIDYACGVQDAGADAIELDIGFVPADPAITGSEVEQRCVSIVTAVKSSVSIPVAVKIGPYFSSLGAMARALVDGGADALVLFNRFSQPDVDIATLRLTMAGELSVRGDPGLAWRWIAILSGRLPASLAASTGVESADDVFKYLLAGADVVVTTDSLRRQGIAHMRTLLHGLSALLAAREIESLSEVRGRMSQRNLSNPTALERAHDALMLGTYHAPRRP